MGDFKTYNILQDISKILYKQSDNTVDNYALCWQYADKIQNAILADIKTISRETAYLEKLEFHLDNPDYRQSAAGCFATIKFDPIDPFEIQFELLLTLNKVLVKVKNRPDSFDFNRLADIIESKYNSAFETDLQDLYAK